MAYAQASFVLLAAELCVLKLALGADVASTSSSRLDGNHPYVPLKRTCPAGCETVGNCNAETGLCECPWGYSGERKSCICFSRCIHCKLFLASVNGIPVAVDANQVTAWCAYVYMYMYMYALCNQRLHLKVRSFCKHTTP